MTRIAALIASTVIAASPATATAQAAGLDIYFVDVEGGQATLVITPERETLLIDTGFPGSGTFGSRSGDAREARDAQRIAAAARDAGVTRIDYLLITHFHGDHVGGVPELAQLLPIGAFVDHGTVSPDAESNVPGTNEIFEAYRAIRERGRHLEPRPGDRLPLRGVAAVVVSSKGTVLESPLRAAGPRPAACADPAIPARDPYENPRSTGVLIEFGDFRFLDVGDLTGPPLLELVCPTDLIGPVDAYLVAHHGGGDAAVPATFAAFKPRVAILNNGATKGGSEPIFATLRRVETLKDVWQLHWSEAAGAANFADDRIANLDEQTAHWLKLSASDDGSFRILNNRTGVWTSYGAP